MFTYESKIKDDETIPFIKEMNSLYGHLERKLYNELYVKKPSDKNRLKRDFCKDEGISSTHFNSLKNTLSAKIDSRLELAKVNVKEDEERVGKTSETVSRKEKRIAKLKEAIKKIGIYQDRLRRYNRSAIKPLRRKPKKPSSVDSCRPLHELRTELKQLKHEAHQKKRRLGFLNSRLEKNKKMIKSGEVSICFGSRKLLNKQHHLKENGYSSHEEWKKEWEFARSNQSFWLGDSTEKGRNRNARLNLDEGSIRFTVPERLRDRFGPVVAVKGLSLDQRAEENIRKSLEYEKQYFHAKSGKFRKRRYPVSCRILERMKKKKSCFYLQVCVEVPPETITTNRDNGAIGSRGTGNY